MAALSQRSPRRLMLQVMFWLLSSCWNSSLVYCGDDIQRTLAQWGIRSSMSRKGNCWDNAPTESLLGHLKTACVHCQKFATRDQARQAILDWIGFYNHSRPNSTLVYMSPMQYENRWLAAQRRSAA